MKTKSEYCVINPSGHKYFFTAYDKFEAIYYAKKKMTIDGTKVNILFFAKEKKMICRIKNNIYICRREQCSGATLR